jgi:type I restriction enzyme, S subunit
VSSFPIVPLSELMALSTCSVNPADYPDEIFELYSIPAYDIRCPEVVPGSEIGSTKQVVQPNDVLLST